MIHRLSYSIANWLGKQAPHHSVAVVAYGIETLLIAVIQLALILLTALWLGLFWPALIVLAAFGVLRMASGGKHLSTFWSCTLTDIVMINGLGWLSLKAALTPWNVHVPLYALLATVSWIAVQRYAPLITVSRPQSLLQTHGQTFSKGIVLIGFVISSACYFLEPVISAAIVLGMAAQALTITPVGCKALDHLDRWLSSR